MSVSPRLPLCARDAGDTYSDEMDLVALKVGTLPFGQPATERWQAEEGRNSRGQGGDKVCPKSWDMLRCGVGYGSRRRRR
jgi:hypothetical protein